MVDRVVAFCAAIAAIFYLIASISFWLMLATRREGQAPFKGADVVLDRAIAWSALTVIFGSIAIVKMHWTNWMQVDAPVAASLLIVTTMGLFSVRAMTKVKYGNRVWLFYFCAITMFSVALYTWG